MGTTSSVWLLTLREVRQQYELLARLQPKDDGDWVDLDPAEAAAARDPKGSRLWPQHQWHTAFEMLFAATQQESNGHVPHRDDMLFFVYLPWLQRREPLFVRRRGAALPAELSATGALAAEVDWRATLALNLAMQTRYSLTVSACRYDDLSVDWQVGGDGETAAPSSPTACRVRLEAWPSTSRALIDLEFENSRAAAAEPACTYPDVCFEVSTFDSAFEALVLRGSDACYSVVLHAHVADWVSPDGAAADDNTADDKTPGGDAASGGCLGERDSAALAPDTPRLIPARGTAACGSEVATAGAPGGAAALLAGRAAAPLAPLAVFSGFVTRRQLTEAGVGGTAGSMLQLLGGRRAQRVLMNGPGGRGRAEVAVMRTDQKPRPAGRRGGLSLGHLVRGVQAVVRDVAAGEGVAGRCPDLQCSLISLCMPVQALAASILDAL